HRGVRPLHGLAGAADRPLRRGVLDRAPAGGSGDGAVGAADAGTARHAPAGGDAPGAALDGQPHHRGGPRRRRPPLAPGRPGLTPPRRPPALHLILVVVSTTVSAFS